MIKSGLDFLIKAMSLPKLIINLGSSPQSRQVYQLFNSRHPKFPLLKRKTVGVEIIFLDNYTETSGKNSASYFRRKCLKNNYKFSLIDPDLFREDILCINSSLQVRQGRVMEHLESHRQLGDWDYLGILDKENKLVAYLFIQHVGELSFVGPILGHGDYLKDGIMYLLFTEAVNFLISKKKATYFMYDMFFGASPGLKMFKSRIGFNPYRVKWTLK